MVPETTVPGTVTFCGSLCGPESSMPSDCPDMAMLAEATDMIFSTSSTVTE